MDPAHQGRPPPEHGNPQLLEPHVLRAGRSAREAPRSTCGGDRRHLSRCLLVRPHRHRGLPRDELRSAPHLEQRSGQVTFQLDSQARTSGRLAVLSYDLTGLTRGVEYDLQVRAVSADGAGLWSDVFNGHTTALPPGPPANLSVNPRDLGLGVVWNEPAFTGGELITDVRPAPYCQRRPRQGRQLLGGPTTPASGRRTATLFTHNIESLTNGISYDVQARATNSVDTSDWSSTCFGHPARSEHGACIPAVGERHA